MKKLFTLIAALCFFGSVSAVNHLLEISTSAKKTNAWDWAVDYQLATPLVQGEKYVLTLKASTTDEAFKNMFFWPFGKDAQGNDKTQYLASLLMETSQRKRFHSPQIAISPNFVSDSDR